MPGTTHPLPPDPATRDFLEQVRAAGIPPMSELGVEAARRGMLDGRVNDIDPPPVAGVSDHTVPGPGGDIPVRVYQPRDAPAGHLGALLYFHGGGWVVGDLDSHDETCRLLCNGAGAVVVSIDYRLAPETPFPGGLEDCYAATVWLGDNAAAVGGDGSRIAVGLCNLRRGALLSPVEAHLLGLRVAHILTNSLA